MDLRKIYSNLGLSADLTKEVAKINNKLFIAVQEIDHTLQTQFGYEDFLLKKVVFELGETNNFKLLKNLIDRNNSDESFQKNLFVVQVILESLRYFHGTNKKCLTDKPLVFLEAALEKIFASSLLDVGYTYQNGGFIKSGAKELDEKLIVENIEWLKKYPAVRENFSNALKFYLNKPYPDAITNAYSALEGISKILLNKNKRLDDDTTRKELVNRLDLHKEWGQVLFNYCKVAQEFSSRHGKKSPETNTVQPELVEFYIYQTGVFLRLITQKIRNEEEINS